MRLLHLVHDYPPETHGGTQEYVAGLAELQRAAGHAVGVIAGSRIDVAGGAVEESVERGVAVWRVRRDHGAERLSGDFGCARIGEEVERLVSIFAPDVVHVHHWHGLTNDLVRRVRAGGIPVVLTLHDLFATCPRFFRMPDHRSLCEVGVSFSDCSRCVAADAGGAPAAEVERLLTQRAGELRGEVACADRVLTMSAAQHDLLGGLGVFGEREARILPIGIPRPGPPPAPPAPAPGRLRMVNWAGLDPRKGIHVLLQAVAESRRRDDLEVHLYGRDGEAGYMQELRTLGANAAVCFHGPYEDAERAAFAARFDLAVFPFLAFETHGLVVDEALHAGVPVLVSDLGAPPDRIGGRGAVFPAGDAEALARLLEGLLDDPARLAAMRVAEHGAIVLEAHHTELAALYDELATAGRT